MNPYDYPPYPYQAPSPGYFGPPPFTGPVQPNGVPIHPLPEEEKWIKKAYNWTGAMLFVQLGVAFAVAILALLIGMLSEVSPYGGTLGEKQGFLVVLGTALGYLAGNLLCFFIGCRVAKIDTRPLFHWNNTSAGSVLTVLGICLGIQAAVVFLSNMGISLIDSLTGVDFNRILGNQERDFASELLLAVYTCVIAPITEELVFRVFCLKQLSRFNVRFGIIASALLFGLMHGNIIQFLLAFPLGILLAWLTVKSGSVLPAILVHFFVNTTATLLSKLAEQYPTFGEPFYLAWLVFFVLAGALLLVFSLVVRKKRLPEKTLPKRRRGWPLFFRSGAMVTFVCVYGFLIILPLFLLPFLPMLKPLFDIMYP